MRKYIFLSFIFVCIKMYSQTQSRFYIQDSIASENRNKKEKEIIEDFKDLNYDKLINEIVSDIDFNRLKNENIIFYLRSRKVPIILISPFDRVDYSDYENPAFNQTNFWNKKSVIQIIKEHHKNLIPYLISIDSFLLVEEPIFKEQTINYRKIYNEDAKRLLKIPKRKKGILIDKTNNITNKQDFYYFSNHSKNVTTNKDPEQNNENCDTLYLQFRNYPNKTVVVSFTYNHKDKVDYKTYQFKNNDWIKVPTPEEYKF